MIQAKVRPLQKSIHSRTHPYSEAQRTSRRGMSSMRATANSNFSRILRRTVLGLLVSVLATYASAERDSVTMIDLGTLPGGGNSVALDINDKAQAVGNAVAAGGYTHAVLWEKGGIVDLDVFPGDAGSNALAINNRGQVVGYSYSAVLYGPVHAVLWQDGRVIDLGGLPGAKESMAIGINEKGQIVGSSGRHAVLWDNGKVVDLGVFSEGATSSATRINNHSQIIGHNSGYPVLWEDGLVVRLLDLNGGSVRALNNKGEIVGYTNTLGSTSKPFVWRRGVFTFFGFPGQAHGINNHSQVVGNFATDDGAGYRAFLWDKGVTFDLGTLPGDYFSSAGAINNQGEVVGASTSLAGRQRAFLARMK